jgi:hypothetical protein
MNKTYKVIYNRTRCMYQVVSELAKGHTKSETPEMLKSLFSKHSGLTRGIVMAVLSMSLAMPVGMAVQAEDAAGNTNGNTTSTSDTTTSNTSDTTTTDTTVTVKDGAALVGSGAVSVSSTTSDDKNIITISVPTNGTVEANNTGLVTGGTVYTAITDANTALSNKIGTLDANGNYIQKDASVSSNLSTLDTQIKSNADNITKNTNAISAETTARETADTSLTNKIGTLDANGNYIQKDASVSSNLSTLDTQMKTNADAISKETTDRTDADTALGNRITSNAADITSLKELSNITTAGETVIKKQAKKAVKVAATGNATVTTTGAEDDDSTLTYTINVANNGAISIGDTNLVSGGTLYTELRPASTGTYYYISSTNTTAQNLINLDTTLNKALAALDIDMTDSSAYTSKLSKYFKVNPKETTSDDGKTKTYAPDAAANGTNSVAIGPSAQSGEKTTDATTSTATVTGGESSAAIGDSAKANGNQSVALGYNSQVLNTTDQDGKTTATITGSTAVGSGAKVNGATDATAIGTSAQVNETAAGGIAFGKNAVTGEDKGTVTVGDVTANVAAVGGENSVALGTDAKASGNTALALGNGAQVNNYTTQSGTTVTKTVNSGSTAIGSSAVVTGANDAVALGTGASVTGTGDNADDSMAIGKGASVATAKDAMALGTSAAVASGATNAVAIGNTAKANTSSTTAIGYNANATGAGAVAIGENTSTSTEGGISIGSGTSVSGKSIVIGYATDANGNTVKTESQNTDAVAIGNGAQANANDSISIGHQAGKDTSEGRTSGYGSLIAIGTNAGNNVKGMQNVALGSGAGSNVKSSYNVAIGSNAGAGINYAAAADSNPQDGYNISIGYEANYQSADANAKNIKESIAIGHSANAVSEATALGTGATASGDKSMALGYNAAAADTDSIALGDKASAGGGNIAIGSGSQAPAVTTYASSYLTNNTTVNGYISLGGTTSATTGTTVLRRISNVADGSADQDAVTVAQLKAAYTDLEGTIKTTDTKISDTYTQSAIDSKIATVESKITASQTKYFSINPSSDTLTANANNDGASTSGAADAMAIGPNATATSAKAVAIGNNVSASGKGSIALGTADNPATSTTVTEGGNTSANPHVTSAEGANSVAIGTSAIAQTDNSVALGTRASVYTSNVTDTTTGTTTKVGQQSIAIGYEAETRNSNATSIGSGAKAYSDGSTAIGHSAYAQGADSVVLGTSSTANGASSGIVGKSNTINGSNTYAVGSENNVNGNWGAVTYSGLYGSKNIVNPESDTSGNTKHGMDSLSITGNSNTISQGSYSDTVQNISILGNSNSVTGANTTGANTDEANAGTTANITVIGGSNTVTGRDGAGSDDMGKTWNQLTRTTVIGYKNTVNQAASTTSLADTQILGNDVTATLGNSVYLGTGSAAKTANLADSTTLTDAEQAAVDALDTTGMTDTEKATAQANAKAAARYATNLKTMKQSGTTAGLQSLSTDTTYDDGTSYTYAGSSPAGVVTVGTVGSERRLQNVAAGLVSATSTDAVNGSQLYALTRQLRFGGDNSIIGDTTDGDTEVVKRGSGEALSIIGGAGVTTATVDGKTTVTVDSTKLTDNNIGVIADSTNNSLSVKLASDLKKLNTASLGSGSGDSYKETIKLDGTDTTNGGTLELKDATGANGITLRTSGTTTTADVNGTATTRLLVNDKTVATTDDGLKFGGDNGAYSALKLNNKLTVKGGADTSKLTENNIGVVSDGNGTLTVKLNKNVNLGTDGSLTTGAVTATTVTADTVTSGNSTLNTNGLTITNGPSVLAAGINAGSKKITNVTAGEADTDAANYGQVKAAKTTLSQGNNNVTITPNTASEDGHTNYTVSVSNLYYKAGTDTTAKDVALATGLTFNNGKNTTAVAGDNGTITYNLNDKIELGAETDSNNHIVVDGTQGLLTLGMDATINGNAGTASIGGVSIGKSGSNQVITGLTNKTWTVGTTQAVDGRAATENQLQSVAENLNTANTNIATLQHGFKVQANGDTTTESTVKADDVLNFTAGDNAKVTTTKGSKQITISVDNLSVKATNGTAQSVKLADGLNFQDGTNTTAKVGTSGTVTYDLKDSITLGNSTDETNRIIVNGTNGTITAGNLATINGNAGTASIGGVSIGKSGSDQIVTGLSNTTWVVGTTKAVSGRAATEDQLQSVSDAAHTNADNITTLQQGFTVTANGKTDTKSTVKAGETLNFQAGKNVQVSTTADSKSIEVALSDTPEFTTVTAKDASGNATTVSGTGVTIAPTGTGAQSVSLTSEGLDNGNHVIRNVASGGTVRTNAANIGDLQDAISNASTTTTNTGFNVKGDDAVAKKVKLGKQLNVVGGTTDSTQLSTGNIGVETTADAEGNATLTVKLKKDIALDSVTTGSTTINTTGISNGDMSLTNTGMIIKNNDVSKQVSITTSGVSMGSQQVKNVADGTDTKDAVNKGQLDVVQTQVTNGWQIVGSNGQKVADIGAGKKVTFGDTTYATASVQPDGTDGAKVTYTINTAALTADTATGKITEPTTDGVATAQNVAQAINNAAWKIKANDNEATAIKAGTTVGLKAGNNLTLSQSGTDFTYKLNDTLTGIKSLTTAAQDGVTTTLAASGVTIASSDAGNKSVSLTVNGLNNGGKQITDVASGGDTDTNAANISDVKRLVQASASGTAETGFNVKGDDADAKKVKLGKQLNVVGGTTDSTKLSDNNIGVVTTADEDGNATLTVKLNKAIALDSVTTGSSVLNTNGLTITGGPSVLKSGINAGNQKITGVLDGTDTTDAVNKGQLDELANTVNGGWTIQAGNATGNAQIVKPGDKVTLDAGNNLNLTQNGTAFTYSLAEDLTGLKSVMAVDAKDNQAVLTGEGLKVTDKEGNSLTQHTTEIRLHSSNADTADTSKDVVLDNSGLIVGNNIKFTNSGISAGNQKITGVADGELKEGSKEAVNGGQLYELKQQVGSGWKLTGDDTAQATNIGAGAQVSVKSGNFAKVTVNKSDSGATIQYDVQTQEITTNGGKAKTAKNGVATTQDVVDAINDSYWTVTSGQTGTGKATGTAVSNVTAGTAVTLQAGDNLLLNQAGNSFTYALNPVVTGMTSISFTGMGTGSDGKTVNDLVIGLQNGGGANPNKGYYITGLSNTEWNQSNYQGDRAATEAQLKKAIENVSIVKGGGGYGLTADEGANNGGDKNVTQALGSTIAVRGDGTYDENGKLVKAGNVKTVAYTDAAGSGQTGAIQIQLNKDINLGTDGSLQAGGVTLQNNSVTVGTDGVVISSSGTDRTVSNLSNTQWDTAKANQEASAGGYIGSTKAATESQLQQAISQVTTTAQNNEQHIQTGEYTIGKNLDGTDRTDTHSVSMDVVDGQGKKQGSVVIKDVAKASEVGDVSQLHDTLKNSDGTKNVTGAINNLDDRVTGLDNRMDQIYTTAGQHASVSAEDNIQVDSQSKNGTGGTDYKLSLNKEKIDLKNVTIEGNAGAVTAKTVTAEKYNVGDKTYISSDGINANSQKITNVQTGTADTDAANVGQMREADAQLADAIQQTDAGLNEVGRAVNKLGNRLNRVGAGAAALAALHPGTYDPNDKWDFSAGIGHYHDANAVAIGAYYHPNDTTILSIGGSMGGGENMVNAGITWKMGRSGREQAAQPVVVRKAEAAPVVQQAAPVRPAPVVTPAPVTTPAPVKSVALTTPVQAVPAVTTPMTQTTTGDTAALAQILARQTAILEKLAQNQAQAAPSAAVAHGDDIFPDVPDNHWAYAYVAKLEKAGALKGFKRPAVLKSPMMTRDDFASVLYTAMANGATTNPALNGDDSLNRLAQEFKAELKNVKV